MTQARRIQPASELATFRMRPLGEDEIESVVIRAGGRRAHPDATRRTQRGADFVLGSSVIELKILEDEGLDKPERQKKLAALFREQFPGRPTIVLDRNGLSTDGQRTYDRIVEGPIKTAVASARRQLEQSRLELQVTSTVLWVINVGYTSLSHPALLDLVARRARNDTEEIDAVVVSGAYHYSDTFDTFTDWPIHHVAVHSARQFLDFEALRRAWNGLAHANMTEMMRNPLKPTEGTGPIVDISFGDEGTTFVMPTPPMGKASDYFINGRPRQNSTDLDSVPMLGTIIASLTAQEWHKFHRHRPSTVGSPTYGAWRTKEARARSDCAGQPFIAMPITFLGWSEWKRQQSKDAEKSIHHYATELVQAKVRQIAFEAREYAPDGVLPHRFMLLTTEEIGQDMAFDVSHLVEVRILDDGRVFTEEVWANKSMFFKYALFAATIEAIARGVEFVRWWKDSTYAWS